MIRRYLLAAPVCLLMAFGCSREASIENREAALVDRAVVAIDTGPISGARAESDDKAWVYKGIPFAAPPVGDRRWRPPQRVAPWTEVRDATRFGAACLQSLRAEGSFYGQIVDRMDEDCLYLNVWTAVEPTAKAPVMVWIHGGGLTSGHGAEATYDGTTLARRGAVVITINYRLGPLGYFAHPLLAAESQHGSSGNYGVLDQIAALQWVQQNVSRFGGDPGRVTIFGESAGSWSVNHLVASPLAKGLFHRAIAQSGGAFGSFGTVSAKSEVQAASEKLASKLMPDGSAPTLEALRARTGDEILAAGRGAGRLSANVDGWVFPDTVWNIFAAGRQNNVPVILGSNGDEGSSLGAGRGPATLADYRRFSAETYGALASEFLAVYPAKRDEDVLEARVASYTDQSFGWEMRTWARMMRTVSSNAYLYFFSRVIPGDDAGRLRAFHAGEIVYVFGNLGKSPHQYANRAYDDTDRRLSEALVSYWINFAKSGDPNGEGLPAWPSYSRDADQSMEFGNTIEVRTGIRASRLDFMDRFYRAQRGDTN